MACASTTWGLSTLFYKLLDHVPPLEVVSHRILWALAALSLVLLAQGRLGKIATFFFSSRRQFWRLVLAGSMVASNWFLFIVAVQFDRASEASLGYYIFPLVAVAMGAVILRESLTRIQWIAVAIAAGAVATLTVGLGATPWLSIGLAITFAIYGITKRSTQAGPTVSVAAEALLFVPFSIAWLAGVHFAGFADLDGRVGGYFGSHWFETAMFIFSGVLTAGPLILMSYATRRLKYAEVGLISYLNPTIMFIVAFLVFGEAFTIWHRIAFIGIWSALLIYSFDIWSKGRTARSSSTRLSIDPVTEK